MSPARVSFTKQMASIFEVTNAVLREFPIAPGKVEGTGHCVLSFHNMSSSRRQVKHLEHLRMYKRQLQQQRSEETGEKAKVHGCQLVRLRTVR